MTGVPGIWILASQALHLAGAAACILALVWLVRRPHAKRSDRRPTMMALALTCVWAALVAAYGPESASASLAETARDLSWLLVVYRLFAHDGRDLSMAEVRPVVMALAFVEMMQPALLFVSIEWPLSTAIVETTRQISALFEILVAVGALVLLHNLYVGAAADTRDAVRWSASGLAGFWAFELNHYVVSYLAGAAVPQFIAVRGAIAGLMAVPLVLGVSNGLAGRKLRASQSVAFQSLSLLVIGVYLIVMFVAAELVATIGGDLGRLAQVAFLLTAATVTLLWLPSKRLRGWLRVTALKHLFQHRYDYREEWMRLTRTISHHGRGGQSLFERSAKAMADIVDSPAAILCLPGEDGMFREAANWNWPTADRELPALPADFTSWLEREDFVIEIGAHGKLAGKDMPVLPDTIQALAEAWVVVPLIHFDRLGGVMLLARSPHHRALDWEDFDLLKVVGRQLASYLSEHESHGALMESAKFDDFNRRIAFVMHDIKNLASQLSLLARNAERHAENPEFRKDMLITLRSGSDKLTQLLARLGRYGTGTGQPAELVETDLGVLAVRVAERFQGVHQVSATRLDPCCVLADPDALEQAIVHLVQNAVDASNADIPVCIDVSTDGLIARIEIVDSGCGMDAEFIRTRLFKPFVSSKDGGFGIGAFEARELVRAMGGRLDVQSRTGIGTRFTISIPLAQAARFLKTGPSQEVA
ncbi:XrtA/PEP-CTERM system histidine kinase PrsK [Parerythrobacter aurantius]|uniref:XrtA/PEP-CTERM system histidine kinase PrsK n=1 Tax=Parerythrobacter aurantius TaxID=3127706 RepID=UPI003245375A